MREITITTSPVDSTTDMEQAAEQLTTIAQGDLVVTRQRIDRRARRGTMVVTVSREDRFREQLAASPYARFYRIVQPR